jgi:type VI secretion system lysozyme-like protein
MSGSRIRLIRRLGEDASLDYDGSGDQNVIASIREHLECLLNTRRGDAPACPNYGVPDLTGIIAGLPRSERQFRDTLESTIKEHEKRIGWIRVHVNEDGRPGDMRVHFWVEFMLASRQESDKRRLGGTVNIDAVFSLSR